MVTFKLTISDPKTGKTGQLEMPEPGANALLGKHIGDSVDGTTLGQEGYEFLITGGSDYCGFPMRKGLTGNRRKKILVEKSVGFCGKLRRLRKNKPFRNQDGLRRRKSVVPDTITDTITQVNLKVTKAGAAELPLTKSEKK